jgi:hypothetical protein
MLDSRSGDRRTRLGLRRVPSSYRHDARQHILGPHLLYDAFNTRTRQFCKYLHFFTEHADINFQFGGSEAIITALSDEFPKIGRHREIFVACLFSLYFLVGLASCSQGGFYFFHLLDRYAAGYSMLLAVFFEAIAVSWIYGCDKQKNLTFQWRVSF